MIDAIPGLSVLPMQRPSSVAAGEKSGGAVAESGSLAPEAGAVSENGQTMQAGTATGASRTEQTQAANQGAEVTQAASAARSEEPKVAGEASLEQAVESINDYLQANRRAIEFSLDDQAGTVVVTVMDAERKEVIRQIPPEHVLKMMQQMREGGGIGGFGLTERA